MKTRNCCAWPVGKAGANAGDELALSEKFAAEVGRTGIQGGNFDIFSTEKCRYRGAASLNCGKERLLVQFIQSRLGHRPKRVIGIGDLACRRTGNPGLRYHGHLNRPQLGHRFVVAQNDDVCPLLR